MPGDYFYSTLGRFPTSVANARNHSAQPAVPRNVCPSDDVEGTLPVEHHPIRGDSFLEPSLDGATVAMNGVDLPDNMQVMLTNSADHNRRSLSIFFGVREPALCPTRS